MSAVYCPACDGHGVVKARTGGRFHTLEGARLAEEHGRTRPCTPCAGLGIADSRQVTR